MLSPPVMRTEVGAVEQSNSVIDSGDESVRI